MGVITNAPFGSSSGTGGIDESTRECVAWKNFMVNSGGFALAGSASPGSGGGMDGVDRILDNNDFVGNSWYVIEAPDSSYQIMVSKVGEGGSFQRLFINFGSDWMGGGVGVEPTSLSNQAWYWGRESNRDGTFTPEGVIYCAVEDQPPYRFFWVGTQNVGSEATMGGGMALVTLSNASVGIPNYGLIYSKGYTLNDWQNSFKSVHPSYQVNVDARILTNSRVGQYTQLAGTIVPNGVSTIIDDYKFTAIRLSAGLSNDSIPPFYYGEVEWIFLTGNNQTNYQHMDNANFIVFDDTIVPWNGIPIDKAKFS